MHMYSQLCCILVINCPLIHIPNEAGESGAVISFGVVNQGHTNNNVNIQFAIYEFVLKPYSRTNSTSVSVKCIICILPRYLSIINLLIALTLHYID